MHISAQDLEMQETEFSEHFDFSERIGTAAKAAVPLFDNESFKNRQKRRRSET